LFFSIVGFSQQKVEITKFPVFEECTVDDQELNYCFENELKKKITSNYKDLEIAYDEAYSETLKFNVEVTRRGEFVPLATDSFNSRTFIAASRAISSLPKVQPSLGKNDRPVVFNFTVELTINRPKAKVSKGVDLELLIGYELFEDVVNTPF
jgi:hypothetical protein